MTGLVLETATGHVEVLVCDDSQRPRAHAIDDVGLNHTRRLAPLIRSTLERAGVRPSDLSWVAADLGPGSFTGVRVGLASVQALALVSGATPMGATSLAALAHGAPAKKALVVPLVPAGKREVYAGWFRADRRGSKFVLAAPEVGAGGRVVERTREAQALLEGSTVRFVGPGVPMLREGLESEFPGSTSPPWREDGLSAVDLAQAVCSGLGPAAGLEPEGRLDPLYVRPAQAEERVRHRVSAEHPVTLRPFGLEDIPAVSGIERVVFSDPWPESFFAGELAAALGYARIAERKGEIAGYSVAWMGEGHGHLGNLATAPGARRRGVASVLIEDLQREARERGVSRITLEVRVSNFPAQWLYRRHGFRLAGLRRRYYRDTGEDALVMLWRA